MAWSLIDGRDTELEFDNLTVISKRFGPVLTTSVTSSANRAHIAAGIPSFEAWKLLLPYMKDPSVLTVKRV